MSTLTAPDLGRQSQTKVRIPWSPPVEVKGMKSEVKKQAEKDAGRLFRTRLTEDFAVDPVAIAYRLGVEVREPELDQDILGAVFIEPARDPRIVVNRRHGLLRRRYSCAFELGHYVHMSAETNEYKRVDLCDGSEERGGESNDYYAHQFAASLLMPKEFVELFADLNLDDLEMALRLFVPREAMQMRLRGLGLPAPELEAA